MRLRRLDQGSEVKLFDVEASWVMDFSPDGKEIVWVSRTQIWKANVDGSSMVTLVDLSKNPFPFTKGVSWSDDDEIVFPTAYRESALMKISAVGGKPMPLTHLKANEKNHSWPHCLPGGQYVLFTVELADVDSPGYEKYQIAIANMSTGDHQVFSMDQDCTYPRYARSGHLLYQEKEVLFAVPFDLKTLSITGKKVDVLHGISASRHGGLGKYDLSDEGVFVYKESSNQGTQPSTLLKWHYFDGHTEEIGTLEKKDEAMRIGKGGSSFVFVSETSADFDSNKNLWIYDLETKLPMRFTSSESNDRSPAWSADQSWIYYRSEGADGRVTLRRKNAQSPESQPELVAELDAYLGTVSTDGKLLTAVEQVDSLNFDITVLDLTTQPITSKPLKTTSANELWNEISPNGRWLAYTSDVSGSFNVYVAPLAKPDTNVRPVSVDGGEEVFWSESGDQLFYLSKGIDADAIMVVDVEEEEGRLVLQAPRKLFDLPFSYRNWTIDPHNERFLVAHEKDIDDHEDGAVGSSHNVIRIISNFFTLLNEKVPKP